MQPEPDTIQITFKDFNSCKHNVRYQIFMERSIASDSSRPMTQKIKGTVSSRFLCHRILDLFPDSGHIVRVILEISLSVFGYAPYMIWYRAVFTSWSVVFLTLLMFGWKDGKFILKIFPRRILYANKILIKIVSGLSFSYTKIVLNI